jgi:hypothetical protein
VPSSKTELVIHLILIFSFYTKYFEFKF